MKKIPFKLCMITNRHLIKSRPLIEICERALKGGVDCILLREPDLNPKTLTYIGKQFRMLTSRYNAKLIVKDRVDVAQVIEADGVHLGADSIPPEDVRRIFKGLIGYSAHNIEEIKSLEDKVDYFFLSPIFHTRSKPMKKPLGVDYLANAVKLTSKVIYPLGGITPDKIKELRKARPGGIAVMSAFFQAPDPEGLAKSYLKELEGVE